MKPYRSAGAKTANVIAAIANGAIRRTSKSTLVARGSLSIAPSLYGGPSRRPNNGGSALEQIRHVGDDRVPPEEQRALDCAGSRVTVRVIRSRHAGSPPARDADARTPVDVETAETTLEEASR